MISCCKASAYACISSLRYRHCETCLIGHKTLSCAFRGVKNDVEGAVKQKYPDETCEQTSSLVMGPPMHLV